MSKLILLVEDEPTIGELVKAILEPLYEVIVAPRASDAIIFLAEGREPDLALIDSRLPGVQGPELMRVLKRMRPQMKMAYLSGSPEHPNGAESRTKVLYKPFTGPKLLALVKDLIGNA